jgi:WD40 repeat protein
VSSGDQHRLLVWDVSTRQVRTMLRGHTGWVTATVISPDGRLLASGGGDQTIRLWEMTTGTCVQVLQGHTGWVRSLTFSPDGRRLASGGEDGTIVVWDVLSETRQMVLQPDRPYERMNITGVTGLTDAQRETLKQLGAMEDGR